MMPFPAEKIIAAERAAAPERTLVARGRGVLLAVWFALYGSYTLVTPALLDDADSVHAEVAREMLLRHDWVTLYANGIRYLEKAPLLYWSMAASMRVLGVHAAAARVPLALTVLLLAMVMESFGRRAFLSARAGLLSGLMTLLSVGVFLFTRITIPDAMVCLWVTLAVFCYWRQTQRARPNALLAWGFAACCALNVLTKGLIGIVFPLAIVGVHMVLVEGWREAWGSVRRLPLVSSAVVFLAIAATWHMAAGMANPTEGHPAGIARVAGRWVVGLPTDGNVHGWWWFYFMNEHVLRYLNLRVPRDYDTVPLWLFYGLVLVWLAPWSGFLGPALAKVPLRRALRREPLRERERTLLLLGIWAAVVMGFFSFSTRQEYYCLPALPALVLLLAGWMEGEAVEAEVFAVPGRRVVWGQRVSVGLLVAGSVAALVAGFFVLRSRAPGPGFDLAGVLRQNPGDYALSMGHFLDLNAAAMGAFRVPLLMTTVSVFLGVLVCWWARRDYKPMLGNWWLAGGTMGFLLAAHVGLQTFAPVLSSAELARAIQPLLRPGDLVAIDGEYESGSTLGFYLRRDDLHIWNGRSSNLWYGSFFTDAPPIFETDATMGVLWTGRRRVFLWVEEGKLPKLPGPAFLIARGGGKEIVSNRLE